MFEGKVIKYIATTGKEYKGRIIGCVKDVGITIVDDTNPGDYLHCLVMKNAPNFHSARGQITKTRKLFTQYRKGIIAGVIDLSSEYGGGVPSSATCPFGQ